MPVLNNLKEKWRTKRNEKRNANNKSGDISPSYSASKVKNWHVQIHA
jgi:hypothetical protein